LSSPQSGGAVRKLVGASAIYGLGSVLTRGLNFLLLPLYTRYLGPAEYGTVALAVSCTVILGMVYPLGLHSAITRAHYSTPDPEERKDRAGMLWAAMVLAAAGMALVLDRVGAGLAAILLPKVPFDPYLRLTIWTAFLGMLGLAPLVLLQVRQRAVAYVALSLAGALTTALLIVKLVVRTRRAEGYLWGALGGAALMAIPYVLITLRHVRPVWRRGVLLPALAYSLPLVPHAVAGWVLEMSDRAILTRFVPLAEVGVYAFGYQLGAAMGLLTSAFNAAWVPFLFGALQAEGEAANPRLARLVTYYAWLLLFAGLGWALLAKHAIPLLGGPSFHEASRVTPWVIGGYVCSGLYLIPTNLLFWRSRTGVIPLVTLVAGTVNVGLNLLLVPRYGAVAAAWATLSGYGALLLLTWWSAQRVYRFPYEYRRLGLMTGLALALFLAGSVLPDSTPMAEIPIRILLWLAFVPGLMILGVVSRAEMVALLRFVRRARTPLERQPAGS
jgi:O-antigen/teichoic acid export membrane protein